MKKIRTLVRTLILIPITILKLIFYLPIVFFKSIIWERFTGHDIFISYARADGFLYANMLANLLAKKGYTCFIDQWENEPGIQLSNKLKSRLENTRMIVLLGTDGALKSNNIKEEIELALERKRQIMPIDFGNIEMAIWYPLVKGLPISKTIPPVDDNYQIKGDITDRITSSFKHTKRLRLLNFSYLCLFVVLFIGYLTLIYMFDQVNRQKSVNKKQFDEMTEIRETYYLKQSIAYQDKLLDTSNIGRKGQEDSWLNDRLKSQEKLTETYQKIASDYEKEITSCKKKLEECKKGNKNSIDVESN